MTLPDRVLRWIVVTDDGCWEWTASTNANGYGQVYGGADGPKMALAHRFVWSSLIGPPPPELHHECRNRRCVRPHPSHVVALDVAEHHAIHHQPITVCKNGHEMTAENTYERRDRNGRTSQQCRRCKADRQRARYHADPAADIAARTARRRMGRKS